MDWENLSEQRKTEVLGYLYFNRHGNDEWDMMHNSFYTSEEDVQDNDDMVGEQEEDGVDPYTGEKEEY